MLESWSQKRYYPTTPALPGFSIQMLPLELRDKAIRKVTHFLAAEGRVLIICRGRDEDDDKGKLPWPLTKGEIEQFSQYGLTEIGFDDYMDEETNPVRRFCVEFLKSG